jgi:hypothetical protein
VAAVLVAPVVVVLVAPVVVVLVAPVAAALVAGVQPVVVPETAVPVTAAAEVADQAAAIVRIKVGGDRRSGRRATVPINPVRLLSTGARRHLVCNPGRESRRYPREWTCAGSTGQSAPSCAACRRNLPTSSPDTC